MSLCFYRDESAVLLLLCSIMIGNALVIWAAATLTFSLAAQTTPTVTSCVVTVSDRKYTVYDYADPATKKFCVVIPEGLKTVRGLLVHCNYANSPIGKGWSFTTERRNLG